MKSITLFERDEYQKLMETLELSEDITEEADKSVYFNAWNFGQTERDFEFLISSSVIN